MSAVNDRNRGLAFSQEHASLLSKAEQLIAAGQLKEGAALCQQVLSENEHHSAAYYLMAEIYRKLSQHEKALQFNDLALRFQPDSDDVYFQRGKLNFVLKRWDEAEQAFHNAHRLRPDNVVALALKGDAQAENGDFDAAMATFDQALKIEDSSVVREHKGLCQLLQEDTEGAQATFRALIRHQPNYASAYVHLAKMLLDEEEDEAEKLLRKAEMLNPNHQEALAYICKLALRQGDLALAIEYARRAHKQNPLALIPNLLAAEALRAGALFSELEPLLRGLIAIYPHNAQLILHLVPVLIMGARHEEALAFVEQGLRADPENAPLKHMRASLTGEATDVAPEDYVSIVFDNYAHNFDQHLQTVLGYRTPQLIAEAVQAALPSGRSDYSLLDLGCGTGLAAEALRDMTDLRVGVDLSSKMIEQALHKGIYTEAHVEELVRYMQQDARQYDMVVAADVLVYIGKLDALFAETVKRMAAGGVFALSVEREETAEATFVLRPSGRYAHSDAYVEQLAAQHGLKVVSRQVHDLRKEATAVIQGTLFVLQAA